MRSGEQLVLLMSKETVQGATGDLTNDFYNQHPRQLRYSANATEG